MSMCKQKQTVLLFLCVFVYGHRHTPSPRISHLEDLGLSTRRAMTRLIRMGVLLKRQACHSDDCMLYEGEGAVYRKRTAQLLYTAVRAILYMAVYIYTSCTYRVHVCITAAVYVIKKR